MGNHSITAVAITQFGAADHSIFCDHYKKICSRFEHIGDALAGSAAL